MDGSAAGADPTAEPHAMLARRPLIKAAAGALLGSQAILPLAAPAIAAPVEDEFVFAGDTGLTQRFFEKYIIPDFVAKNGVRRFVYVPGPVSENLAKVRSQRASPQIDVVWLAGASAYQAVDQKLIVPPDLSRVTNTRNIPAEMWPDPALVPACLGVVGLLYNKQIFDQKGFATPTSWFDMWSDAYSHHVGFLSITATATVALLLLFAKIISGDAFNFAPAYEKLAQLKPHMYDFFATAGAMDTVIEQGDLWMFGYMFGKAVTFQNTGVPVAFVTPKEGAVGYTVTNGIVNGARHPNLAHAWIDHLAEPEVQNRIVSEIGYWPVIANPTIPPTLRSMLPDTSAIFIPDWRRASRMLPEIVSTWNRRVEG